MEPTLALIQLPIPDPDPAKMRINVPLTAGTLKAYCVAIGGVDPASIRIIPRGIVDYGGDEAIISWIDSVGPDVVGFSCSMWNLRRSKRLAEKIKERMPDTLTIAGGPEIVSGQPILECTTFDSFVAGEGEGALLEALRDLKNNGSMRRHYGEGPLLDLANVPNPYLFGAMEQRPGDLLYVETLRGCSHRCSYCYYGKGYPELRFFPQQMVESIFHWARAHEVSQIYLIDPSSDSVPQWEDRLRLYASLNGGSMSISMEIHLESVATVERADLLLRAGVTSIEVGLQSTNDRALKAVNRAWEKESFLRGAQLLKERGIQMTIGIILGLPEDTREGFAATVNFLAENGLHDSMNILPLSVLPGTLLREEAAERGIRYMPDPPYFVLSTPTMSEDDLRVALHDVEQRTVGESKRFALPHFWDESEGFTGFLDLRDGSRPSRPERLANSITILLGAKQIRSSSYVEELGSWFLRTVPHSLFQIVVESETPLDAESEMRVAHAFHVPERWLNTVPLFRLARSVERNRATAESADLVLRFSNGVLAEEKYLLEKKPFLLLAGPVHEAAERELGRIYKGSEKCLLRAPRPI